MPISVVVTWSYHSSDASCKMWLLSVSEIDFSVSSIWKKSSYRKNVHHNLSIKYASRCWAKRKWRNVLWDKPFPGVQTNRVESWKHSTEKYHDQTIKFTPCSRTNSILLLSLFTHLQSVIFDVFSHDSIVKIKLPPQC